MNGIKTSRLRPSTRIIVPFIVQKKIESVDNPLPNFAKCFYIKWKTRLGVNY